MQVKLHLHNSGQCDLFRLKLLQPFQFPIRNTARLCLTLLHPLKTRLPDLKPAGICGGILAPRSWVMPRIAKIALVHQIQISIFLTEPVELAPTL